MQLLHPWAILRLFFYGSLVGIRQRTLTAHHGGHFFNPLQGEGGIGKGLHGDGHELHGVVVCQNPVGADLAAAAAAVDDGSFAFVAHPYSNGFHQTAAVRLTIAGLNVHVETV